MKKFNRKFDVFMDARNLEEFFEKLVEKFENERIILAFDEFSYWIEKEKDTISSQFQYVVDEIISRSKVVLIVCGSLISTMESMLSYKNPLYGRTTLRLRIQPLSFLDTCKFFRKFEIEDLVRIYACTGGVPAYLKEFDDSLTFEENINRTFFNKNSILFDDAERLLKDELREPYVYLSILEQISNGATTLSKISSKSRVNITNLPKYLRVLENMGIVRKVYPVIKRGKGKRGVYRINDSYFHFWLRFIRRFKDEIELGIMNFSAIKEEFNRYVGEIFEDLAVEFVIKCLSMPFNFTKIGRWWYKDEEIDLVALNDVTKQIAFFEIKWRDFKNKQEVKRILKELKRKSKSVDWFSDERNEYFGLIAREIDEVTKEKMRQHGYLIFDLEDCMTLQNNFRRRFQKT